MRINIDAILAKHPRLNYHGFKPYPGWEDDMQHLLDEARYPKLVEWILKIEKIQRINYDAFSYALKHRCEDALGEYVSNGQIIVAAILAGFKVHYTAKSKNARFNMSNRTIKGLKTINHGSSK